MVQILGSFNKKLTRTYVLTPTESNRIEFLNDRKKTNNFTDTSKLHYVYIKIEKIIL